MDRSIDGYFARPQLGKIIDRATGSNDRFIVDRTLTLNSKTARYSAALLASRGSTICPAFGRSSSAASTPAGRRRSRRSFRRAGRTRNGAVPELFCPDPAPSPSPPADQNQRSGYAPPPGETSLQLCVRRTLSARRHPVWFRHAPSCAIVVAACHSRARIGRASGRREHERT